MTAAELIKASATALYGDRPQTAMARDLQVTTRTVNRWLLGHTTPATEIFTRLLKLLQTRQDELGHLHTAITEYLESQP